MNLHRDQRWISRVLRFRYRLLALTLLVTSGTVGGNSRASAADPLILFNHEQSGALVYSYFDTADPGMVYPVDIAEFSEVKACKTLGVFNGVLYIDGSDGTLMGIDLGSAKKLILNMPLPERYVQEGPMICIPPGKENPDVVRMIDLRGPFARTVLLPSESGKRHNAYYATDDHLRYFYHDGLSERQDPAAVGEVDTLQCTIEDLRSPESPLLRFSATVQASGQSWRIEPPHWTFPGRVDPIVTLVRHPPQFEAMPFIWIGHDTFACVALAVEVEGFVWEGTGDGGPSLFVLNVQTRTGRVLPLSTLPVRSPLDPKEGGFDPNYFSIDSRSMKLLDQKGPDNGGAAEVLSEHFNLSRHQGPMQVLHGAQPLEMNREQAQSHTDVDSTGERILLRFPRGSVCYDIYDGYYAACEPQNYFRFMERSELHRVEAAPPTGWTGLLPQPARGLPEAAPARRDRASAYELVAVPSQMSYPGGEPVSIQITLTYKGASDAWSDVPAPDFPVLSGTLAGPTHSVVISDLPELTRQPPATPVYLGPGGALTSTLEFIPEGPGNYTLALAYGGNSDSEWFGRAKAPLLRFTVGERGEYVFDGPRLRLTIEDFVKRRGNTGDKLFDELTLAGDEGADLLAQFLLDTPMPRFGSSRDVQDHISSIYSLHEYLRQLSSPRQVPFFEKLLASGDTNVKGQGLAGIRALHKDSKDPEFRARLEGIVREAFADDEPVWRAGAQRDLGVVLWPDEKSN